MCSYCSHDVDCLDSVVSDEKCQPCQRGWRLNGLSCYEANKPASPGWKTWAEAQEDCSGKNSNLSVVHSVKVNPLI